MWQTFIALNAQLSQLSSVYICTLDIGDHDIYTWSLGALLSHQLGVSPVLFLLTVFKIIVTVLLTNT